MIKPSVLAGLMMAVIPGTSHAGDWETEFGAGLFTSKRDSTDTAIEGSPFSGAYVEGYAATEIDGLRFAIDGRAEFTDDNGANNSYATGPIHTGVLGLHLGQQIGETLVGGYAAIGLFDGYLSDNPMRGWAAGLEAEHQLTNGTIFAQLGYAEAIGDPGDNEFKGSNLRVGYHSALSDRLRTLTAIEYAYSGNCFEDCSPSEWGSYLAADLGLGYDMGNGWEAVGTLRLSSIVANVEDAGVDGSLYVGFTRTFGNRPTSRLRTPMGAFHAAGWMYPLD